MSCINPYSSFVFCQEWLWGKKNVLLLCPNISRHFHWKWTDHKTSLHDSSCFSMTPKVAQSLNIAQKNLEILKVWKKFYNRKLNYHSWREFLHARQDVCILTYLLHSPQCKNLEIAIALCHNLKKYCYVFCEKITATSVTSVSICPENVKTFEWFFTSLGLPTPL